MDGIREYLIGVIASAVLCGIVTNLIDSKSMVGVSVKLVAGLLMLFSVIRPWTSISARDMFAWAENIQADGTDYTLSGMSMAQNAYRDSIITRTRAYILEEAEKLQCSVGVEVILSEGENPVPKQIRLEGEISPYARQALSAMITERLGIEREDQIWT